MAHPATFLEQDDGRPAREDTPSQPTSSEQTEAPNLGKTPPDPERRKKRPANFKDHRLVRGFARLDGFRRRLRFVVVKAALPASSIMSIG
jgi:hypothetical protein